LLPGL
jgi:hypothetical protein